MKYKGKELREFSSEKPVVFDPPREMFVWDNSNTEPRKAEVYAYLPGRSPRVQCNDSEWYHCAEIPKEPKPRRATNLELAKWLAQGNGIYRLTCLPAVWGSELALRIDTSECAVNDDIQIRKWDDEDWHEPTADYMGLED